MFLHNECQTSAGICSNKRDIGWWLLYLFRETWSFLVFLQITLSLVPRFILESRVKVPETVQVRSLGAVCVDLFNKDDHAIFLYRLNCAMFIVVHLQTITY